VQLAKERAHRPAGRLQRAVVWRGLAAWMATLYVAQVAKAFLEQQPSVNYGPWRDVGTRERVRVGRRALLCRAQATGASNPKHAARMQPSASQIPGVATFSPPRRRKIHVVASSGTTLSHVAVLVCVSVADLPAGRTSVPHRISAMLSSPTRTASRMTDTDNLGTARNLAARRTSCMSFALLPAGLRRERLASGHIFATTNTWSRPLRVRGGKRNQASRPHVSCLNTLTFCQSARTVGAGRPPRRSTRQVAG